jgi:endonuclease YncB( thermonuclease family)
MAFLRYAAPCAILLAGLGSAPAAGNDAPPCGGKEALVRIAEAADGHSLRLADGRVVRLAQVVAPLPIDGDAQAIARAKASLSEIAAGKDAKIYFASEAADRYGRLPASAVMIEGKLWLEAELLARGLVRMFPSANEKCMQSLAVFESKARNARSGIWSAAAFRVFDAGEIEALLASPGRFTLVEGTIRRVGEARGRIYLDFGRRFTEDFTIIVPDSLRKNLLAAGLDPKNWRGRRIRVRGILFSWGGPAIEINLAQAIEFLDSPKSE